MTESSLTRVGADSLGTLMPFLPDTPWTTPPLHVVQQRHGRAFVDSPESPRNLVVVAEGDGTRINPHQAFLFGVPTSHGLREFVSGVEDEVEYFCDTDIASLVREFHPDVKKHESVVAWFDYLEVEIEIPEGAQARRLRMSDSRPLEALLPKWAYRTFATSKDLIMSGTVYGIYVGDDLVCAAFTIDHSVKFERLAVVTHEHHRNRGYGHAALAKLVNGCGDRGRIPCCVVPRDNMAAWRLAQKIGFPQKAVLWTYKA